MADQRSVLRRFSRREGVLLFSVALVVLGGAGVGAMTRKDLPHEIEFSSGGDRISVINASSWNKRNYDIVVTDERGISRKVVLYGDKRHVTVDNLVPGNSYRVAISRKDIIGKIRYRPSHYQLRAAKKPYVVLVGASIGKEWAFPSLSQRVNRDDIDFGYRFGANGFDKEDVVKSLTTLESPPTVVIIKECAAYFPRDPLESVAKIREWVQVLQQEDVLPILATTVPVTRKNDGLNTGRQASINLFNSALRDYAAQQHLSIMDLQRALEDDSPDHFLREEYASADGLHLNSRAYAEALDQAAVEAVADALTKRRR